MKRETQDNLGMNQWVTPGAPKVMAVSSGKGKGKQKGYAKGDLTVKFTGQCLECDKTGYRMSECWWNEEKLAKSTFPEQE